MKKTFGEITKFVFFIFFYFFLFDLLIGNYVYKKILRKNYFDVEHNMGKEHPVYHHGLKKIFQLTARAGEKKNFHFVLIIIALELNVAQNKLENFLI